MDIFRNPDLEERQEAQQEALNDYRDKKTTEAEATAEQDKKDGEFNQVLEGVTQPLATEFLRKPIEDLGKRAFGKVAGAIRSRVSGVLRSAGKGAKDALTSKLESSASKLGVNAEDLQALRSGDASKIGGRLLGKVPTEGPPTSALPTGELDDETRQVLNVGRSLRGGLPKPAQPTDSGGEPVEVDAFSGKPIERQPEVPRPQEIDEADDWTTQLYDQPITHAPDMPSRLPSTRAPVDLGTEPENPADRVVANRLSNIFKGTDTSDLPTPSFKPAPRVQPPEASAGDTQTLDQLAPMREAMKAQEISPESALKNRSILDQFQNTDADLRTGQTQTPLQEAQSEAVSGGQTPAGQEPLQGQPNPVEGQPAQTAPEPSGTDPTAPKPDLGPGGEQDSNVDASVSKTAGQEADQALETGAKKTIKDVGTDALESFGESEAVLGGPEDPLADIVGLFAGLGTLFGGLFGGHHHKAVTSDAGPVANAGVQQGVF